MSEEIVKNVVVPAWVAPPGTRDLTLWLGRKVRFSVVLEKMHGDEQVGGIGWGGWTLVALPEELSGVVVGTRTVWSGRILPDPGNPGSPGSYYEPPEPAASYRARDVTHSAVVVAYHMRKNPVLVLASAVQANSLTFVSERDTDVRKLAERFAQDVAKMLGS